MDPVEKAPDGAPAVEDTTQNTPPADLESAKAEDLNKHADAELEARNKQLFERTKKAEAEAKAAKDELEKLRKSGVTKPLDVDEIIDINASLEGLDKREQEWLAQQHKLTGQPLSEIRKGEDFLLWQTGYKVKVEKERALKPSGAQPNEDRPKGLRERLSELNSSKNFKANLEEQEKLLKDAGLYKEPRPKSDRVNIGPR